MIEVKYNQSIDTLPMDIVNDIAFRLGKGAQVVSGIDKDYKVYVYIRNLDWAKKGLLSTITGRGNSYKDACISYLYYLLDRKFTLHFYKGYKSKIIREYIENTLFKHYYPENPNIESQ